ncbi:MAG: oligosaccharide flippase family protein, partial [Clostridiales bacterium]|nr:oligosaccharide flippase family protein [Clostridiales bacterium]
MAGKTIIQSTVILTAANIINRIFGFVYRIYMSNMIGAEGMGLYQLIMPVYSLAWSISCSGFTTTVSKITASEKIKGEYGNMGRVLKIALTITVSIGTVLSVLLFFGADMLAMGMFNDTRLIPALKILSVSFPFMAAGSCIRGYFIGLQETTVPAVSQVFEQCVRMAVIYILGGMFIPMGLTYACAVAVAGILAGEFLSFLLVVFAYKGFKVKNNFVKKPSMPVDAASKLLISMAMPLALNRITGSVLGAFENTLLPRRLMLYGMTNSQAVSEFGKISGMAMPLIYFPSAMLVALAVSLVP